MTILFLASRAFTPFRGGIERFSLTLGDRFVADGHAVYYLSTEEDYDSEEERLMYKKDNMSFLPNDKNVNSAQNREYVLSLVKEYEIDILFNQQADNDGWISLCEAVKKQIGVKVVTILHFDPYHYTEIFRASNEKIESSGLPFKQRVGLTIRNTSIYRYRQFKLFGKVFTHAVNASDAFVLLSEHSRQRLMDMVGKVDERKIIAISNPVTVGNNSAEISEKKKQLLFVGRMAFLAKRPDLLLEVWKQLYKDFSDWEMLALGDGDYLSTLKQLAAEYELQRIQFIGNADSSMYYPYASILCVTSNSEGFPLVAVEASQNYVVPVAFNSFTAVQDVIKHEHTGFIVPAFDIDAYVSRLRQLMTNPSLLNQMANNAHEYVSKFNMDNIAPQWYELFESLMR